MFSTADIEDISQVTSFNTNSSTSRNVQHSPQNTQVAKQNRGTSLKMLIKEFICCLAIALTAYGALPMSMQKAAQHPQPVQFFNPHAPVADWYKGQLEDALSAVNNADIAFVMYYAPWDAESQHVRREFEKAAYILGDRVHFSGINCWNPGSECRVQHEKVASWPILMAYSITSRGILYKGPKDAHSMVKFLELIMRPLERISRTEDLVNLLSYCDAVAVGFTPLSATSKYYNVWYSVAMKFREFDIMGEMCFGVVTSEDLAIELGVESLPNARLMLWNDTQEYKTNANLISWNELNLTNWVIENFSQPISRIMPMWRKAFTFERFVDGSPLLMMFTPLNPIYEQLPYYGLMRETAMDYYNCKKNESSQWITEIMKLQQMQRLIYQQKDFTKFCQDYKFKKHVPKPNRYLKSEVISQNNKYPWINTTERNQKGGMINFFSKKTVDISKLSESPGKADLLSSMVWNECSLKTLPAEKSYYETYEQCQSNEDNIGYDQDLDYHYIDAETTMLPLEDDPLSSENLIQENMRHFCKLMKFANEFSPVLSPTTVHNANLTDIRGLACAKNYSLNMIVLDSVHNHHFAESLGIEIANKKDMTAVVILDSKEENQYILSEEFTASSIRQFIYNFTNKKLKRSLRTHVEDAAHTHYFGSNSDAKINEHTKDIDIIELTTKTFRRFVRRPGKVSIVVVCGGGCGAVVSRAAAEGARLVAACGVPARLARIDARAHDLPWHYTPPSYPAILVFDTTRGGEPDSRAYPAARRVTVGGVVALVLRALPAPHRMRLRLALCREAHANSDKRICLKDLREHITTLIGRNLKFWRQTPKPLLKEALLKRLQILHSVSFYLNLLHISDLSQTNKVNTLLDSISTLSKNWDFETSILKSNVTITSVS